MTHSNEFSKAMPYVRRKLNAKFVHELKKLVGKLYRLHVEVMLGDAVHNDDVFCGDYVFVFVPSTHNYSSTVIGSINALCDRYGIGSNYIEMFDGASTINGEDVDGVFVEIYLEKPIER